MATPCAQCPLRTKALFKPFSEEDVRAMQRFKAGELVIEAGTRLLVEGSNAPQLYTALRGMGLRYKLLRSGRRQVINLLYPGDFIGLQAAMMGEMQHSVEATTRMTLCVFDRTEFWRFLRANPERAYDVIWIAAIEEHFLGEALASVAQRPATERIAWALVRIFRRGQATGLTYGPNMPLPYRQQDLADALGLSLVHTNKTLAKLRERQLASWSDRTLQVNDLDALEAIAQTGNGPEPMRPLM